DRRRGDRGHATHGLSGHELSSLGPSFYETTRDTQGARPAQGVQQSAPPRPSGAALKCGRSTSSLVRARIGAMPVFRKPDGDGSFALLKGAGTCPAVATLIG